MTNAPYGPRPDPYRSNPQTPGPQTNAPSNGGQAGAQPLGIFPQTPGPHVPGPRNFGPQPSGTGSHPGSPTGPGYGQAPGRGPSGPAYAPNAQIPGGQPGYGPGGRPQQPPGSSFAPPHTAAGGDSRPDYRESTRQAAESAGRSGFSAPAGRPEFAAPGGRPNFSSTMPPSPGPTTGYRGPGEPPMVGAQPLGRKPEATVSIDDYKPGRSTGPIIAAVVVVVALVVGVLGYFGTRGGITPPPDDSQSPTATSSPGSTPTAGVAFEGISPKSAGHWEIVSADWQSDKVVLVVRITVDSGSLSYKFYAYDEAGSRVFEPNPVSPAPALKGGRVAAGQTVEGTVTFSMPRQGATLILADSSSRPISGQRFPT